MTEYRVSGISPAVADEVRRTLRSPQYGHPAHREVAAGYGPCRLCLRRFSEGREDRILFTYQPFLEDGALPAPGPVFVHAEDCPRYDAAEFPPELEGLPVVVEGFGRGGRLVAQERVGSRSADEVVRAVLARPDVGYAHLRNGEAGCFMARVDRAG